MNQNIDNTLQTIEFLKDFVSPERFSRLESRLEWRTRYMLLGLEDIFYPHNASATIRSAEAFGLQEIHAVQSLCHFRPSRHIVRGTDQWLDINRWDNTPSLVSHLRSKGYRIVVTAPREGGSTVESFDINAGPFALFMGTEKTGISEQLMQEANDAIYIPMVGFAESLNISVSAAIIMQELTTRIRKMEPHKWQLSHEERQKTLLNWLKCSIRDVEGILKRMPVATSSATNL